MADSSDAICSILFSILPVGEEYPKIFAGEVAVPMYEQDSGPNSPSTFDFRRFFLGGDAFSSLKGGYSGIVQGRSPRG